MRKRSAANAPVSSVRMKLNIAFEREPAGAASPAYSRFIELGCYEYRWPKLVAWVDDLGVRLRSARDRHQSVNASLWRYCHRMRLPASVEVGAEAVRDGATHAESTPESGKAKQTDFRASADPGYYRAGLRIRRRRLFGSYSPTMSSWRFRRLRHPPQPSGAAAAWAHLSGRSVFAVTPRFPLSNCLLSPTGFSWRSRPLHIGSSADRHIVCHLRFGFMAPNTKSFIVSLSVGAWRDRDHLHAGTPTGAPDVKRPVGP